MKASRIIEGRIPLLGEGGEAVQVQSQVSGDAQRQHILVGEPHPLQPGVRIDGDSVIRPGAQRRGPAGPNGEQPLGRGVVVRALTKCGIELRSEYERH